MARGVDRSDSTRMKTNSASTANDIGNTQDHPQTQKLEEKSRPYKRSISRRSFLGKSLAVGAGTVGAGFLINTRTARASGALTPGDAALLRFPAALEILEADFWIQYNELGGIQDSEVPGGSGIPAYHDALSVLDEDMDQYIHDNTDDEITHHKFLNAYLVSKGAAPANLNPFRTLRGSIATGVNPNLIGKRLTNLTQLTLDTSWWTRYRDDSHNPDLDPTHVFPQAVPSLHVGQHTAIPRTNADLSNANFVQAMANTAGFHFPTIEQGGNSLYPSLAQRATVTGVSVTFPNLDVSNQLFKKNLIMPEPCPFLSRSLPIVSIIRPTNTSGAAMGALRFLTAMGLFRGQSPAFFAYMTQLAQAADAARHGGF